MFDFGLQDTLAGFLLGLSLIIAIGAQNVFVLQQAIRGKHVFAVCLACALSDAILISFGVGGFSLVASTFTWLEPTLLYGGAIFLFFFGAANAYRALNSTSSFNARPAREQSLKQALVICLALTWLNPHVYLDTVVLLGAVSTNYENQFLFGAGAVTASFTFFFSLGYGARYMSPLFEKPSFARGLDALVAIIMWGIALKLLFLR